MEYTQICHRQTMQNSEALNKVSQQIAAWAEQQNIGLITQISNLLKAGKKTEAEAMISDHLKEMISQVNKSVIHNGMHNVYNQTCSGSGGIIINDDFIKQGLALSVKSVLSDEQLSKIFTNLNQNVKAKALTKDEDFDLAGLLIIGGTFLFVFFSQVTHGLKHRQNLNNSNSC